MLGHGNRATIELAEALAARGAGRRSALPLRQRRRRGGRAGAQDRVPALDEPGHRGPRPLPRLQRRLPRRLDRLAVGRRRRLRHRRVRPAALPGACARPYDDLGRHGGADRRARRPAGGRRDRAARAGRGRHGPAARPAFVAGVAAACREHDVLLICDEVATGFGRTGTLFAVEQCGVRPDLLCLGKGITGGYLPLSATVVSQRVYDAFLGAGPLRARRCTTGTPTAGTPSPAPSPCGTSSCSTSGTCSPTSRRASDAARGRAGRAGRPARRGRARSASGA